VTLGHVTREQAEEELDYTLAQVKRGVWEPPRAVVPERREDPTFHEFASEWFARKKNEVRASTAAAYEWEVSVHLLPFFARHRLSEITVEEVDRYRAAKVRQQARGARLSNESINKTISRLAQILEVAVEYGHIDRNPASGKRRRLKVSHPQQTHLDSAEQIAALLAAAGELDREARRDRPRARRAMIATLTFAGLRISELLGLRWRDLDLPARRLRVADSKTDAGVREIDILPALVDALTDHRASIARDPRPDDLVFPTTSGRRQGKDNFRSRAFALSVARANERLVEAGRNPLPDRLTPHSLRRTFASILCATGTDLMVISEQLGHADLKVTYRIYTKVMRRGAEERERLRALVEGGVLPPIEADEVPRGPAVDVG